MINSKKNNRIEPSGILTALKIALNQEPKVSNNWNNFTWYNFPTCLFCGESSKKSHKFGLSIDNNSFYISCFSCGFKTKTKEDYQRVYDSLGIFQDNNYSKYDETIIKEVTTPAPKISLEKISEILTELNNTLVQSKDHQTKFYNKRGYIMPSDYKSLNKRDLEPLIKKHGEDTIKTIFFDLNKFVLNDKVIIFHRDFTGKIVYYRLYSFTADKRFKKLSPKNIEGLKWLIPFRVELITPETTHLIITEGEEKTDSSNIYKEPYQSFISIPGINNYSSLWQVIEKINNGETNINKISIILDKSNKNDFNEEKASIRILSHLESLLNESITLNICELPTPNKKDKKDKNDLDGFLKEIPEDLRKDELQKIINNGYSLKEYNQVYNFAPTVKLERVKHTWTNESNNKKDSYISPKEARSISNNKLGEMLKNDSNKTLIDNRPAGLGKSYDVLKRIKNENIISDIALPTKEQRNKTGLTNDIQIVESLTDRIHNLIDSDTRFSEEDKNQHKTRVNKLISLGYTDYIFKYLYSEDLTLKKAKRDKNKSAVMTHSMLLKSNREDNIELTYIDELILKLLISETKINIPSLNNYKNYIKDIYNEDNKDIIDFLNILSLFIAENSQELERKSLTKKLKSYFRNYRNSSKSFSQLIENISKMNITLDKDKIQKDIKSNNLNNIPDIDFFNDLIRAFKENRVYFNPETMNTGYFKYYSKISVNKKKVVITDATATPEIYKQFFPNVEYLDFKIKHENIFYKLIADKTYSASTLDIFEIVEKIKDIAKFDYTLVIVPKEIKEKIKNLLPENVAVIHYNSSESKGTNDYKDYKKVIAFPPKVNYNEIINKTLCLDSSITESNFFYKNVKTGFINKNGKGHRINIKSFKNPLLNEMLIQNREADIVQGLFRIKRNTTEKKEFYVFGNVSLELFGLIPDEIITEKNQDKINQIRKKEDFEILKNSIKYSIDKQGFYSPKMTLLDKSNKPETLINTDKGHSSNNIYNIIPSMSFISNNNTFDLLSINEKCHSRFLTMLVNESELIKLSLPLKDNPKHSIYCLPNQEDQAILKAKEYFKDVLLSECMKKDYQNSSKIDDIIKDSINTPTNDLSLDIELKNDSLDNAFKSKEVQKENTTMSYDDYVNTNLSDLYDYLDKFLTDKALKNELINDNDFTLLEDLLNDSTSKCLTLDCFKYEYLINDIADNLISYNQQIKELIDFNKTNSKVISLKEKYDIYVNTNKSYLDKEVNDLIHSIANQDRLIDNQTLDKYLDSAKLHLDNNDIEKSLYYQFLVFNLSENMDKYNLIINNIQVKKDKEPGEPKLDNSYTDTFIDKEPGDNADNHSSILSFVLKDFNKDKELKIINDSILKIPNIDVQKNLRKYISMLIINKIKLTNDYFTKLDKWVLKACDVDELIKRQQLRDFVKLCKNRLEVLIAL